MSLLECLGENKISTELNRRLNIGLCNNNYKFNLQKSIYFLP